MKRLILFIEIIVVLNFANSCFCQEFNDVQKGQFKQVDYVNLILSHPLMRLYDPFAGCFYNTKSQILTIKEIEERVLSLTQKIENIEIEKGKSVKQDFILNIDSENNEWDKTYKLDNEIDKLNKEIEEYEKLKLRNGEPLKTELYKVANTIISDTNIKIYKNLPEKAIVLNRLPYFIKRIKPFKINNESEGYFGFIIRNKKDALKKYVVNSAQIGLLFPRLTESIIYQREK